MKVLVVGGGGREHALCWAIAKSPLCTKLYCVPGNPGIAAVAECLPIPADHIHDIIALCHLRQIDFVVIGSEAQLEQGLTDELRKEGIACFGPSKAAAEIESSKGFMKDLCDKAKVPQAAYKRFTDVETAKIHIKLLGAPIVIKADGLAAGKGVTVARTLDEAMAAIDDAMVKKVFGEAGISLVIEEFMEGEEASFFALCDGENVLPFASAQDHKAAYDGDKGPNTGGMGAYSPAPIVDLAMQERIMRDIIEPTVKAMSEIGRPFTGILYAGLMITRMGPKLIEYNARFGDPETQVMIPRLKSDLLALLYATSKGMLDGINIEWRDHAALCVVMASEGYPGIYKKGTVIRCLEKASALPDTAVFHAGTGHDAAGEIIATGGRVLGVTAWAATISEAQTRAYQAVSSIDWKESFYRHDIGWRAIGKVKAA